MTTVVQFGLGLARFGASLGNFFQRVFQAGGIFDVEDADAAIDLAEQAGQDFAGADFDEDVYAGFDHFVNGIEPADRRSDLADQRVARFIAGDHRLGVDVGDQRKFQRGEARGLQIDFEALLRGHHQGAMKRRGYGQNYGALGTALRGDFDGAFHGGGCARNYGLFGRIQVSGRQDFAIRRFFADFGDVAGRHAQDGGHGAFAGRNGFLHVRAAGAYQFYGGRKIEAAGGDQRGIFAEAVAGDKIGSDALFGQGAKRGDRDGQDGRLSIGRELQFVFGAIAAHLEKVETDGGVGVFEDTFGFGEIIGEVAAHAGILRGLPWKQECEFTHDLFW